MTHTLNDPRIRSPEAAIREARKARDMAISALLAGAATGIGHFAATVGRGLGRATRSIVSKVQTARRRRTAILQMQALDDRVLRDIGISRRDIPFLVEQQMSAEQTEPTAADTGCEITAFPDRQTPAASPDTRLRPAA